MEKEFWNVRWQNNQLGFHQPEINTYLTNHFPRIAPQPARVLVPLCGKSRDMIWLREQGHHVVGIEFIEKAMHDFFSEHGIEATLDRSNGAVRGSGDNIDFIAGDFFDCGREYIGEVDYVYDRASLIALPVDMRPRYAAHLLNILGSGTKIFLLALSYDQSKTDGPPFSVQPDEVKRLFGERCLIEEVCHETTERIPPRFADAGMKEISQYGWLLTVR